MKSAITIPAVPPTKRKQVLGLVMASHAGQHMYSALLPLTYPAILLAFHFNYATLGLAVGIVGIIGGLTQATAGFVGHRVAARWVLGYQNLVVGVCSIIGALAPTYSVFVLAQAAASLGTSQQHPVGSSVAVRVFPERRGLALSLTTIGGSIGSLVIPIPAALLISAWGWRPTLLLMSAPLFVMSAILLLTFPPLSPERQVVRAPGARRFRLPRVEGSQILNRRLAVLAIVAGTVAAGGRGLGTLNTFIPLYLRDQLHLPELTVGALFNLLLVGAVLGPLLVGHLSDRFGRLPVLWAVYGLSAVAVVVFGQSEHFPLAVLALLALAVGLVAYAENPLLQALVSDSVTSEAQSSIFGIYFALSYGVGSLWTIGLGQAIQHLGFAAGFVIMASSYIAAGLILIPCYRSVRKSRRG
ncbi:MAG TPA: MFS transporter [Candidatus Dormibacteraeota bacterium]|nr:MFS transporter [Candidatus Dormibacteraeota bacterium]